ncbi:MAG: bifunctional hydroxymethylpyrimidine kinase/phosphomethylpyrimidine kinase [Verrucomicrobiota bacterium]
MSCKAKKIPVALTVAGSDSGGGAGIQADLKTFASLGVHGTSAITCITAQNPKGVFGLQAICPEMVEKQIEAVLAEFDVKAVKTGMLLSIEIIHAVVKVFQNRVLSLVVDPVMIATSGASLLKSSAVRTMQRELFPLCKLVTPNVAEAEVLTGEKIVTVEDLRRAAKKIHRESGCAALVKGGHLQKMKLAVDIFYDGKTELLLSAPFVKGVLTHGTGCTYSAAITSNLALGMDLPWAVKKAKIYISNAIANSLSAGRHSVLRHQ